MVPFRAHNCGCVVYLHLLCWQVVDTEQKLRETLLHECCHVAAWLLDRCGRSCCTAHGRHFKAWVRRAKAAYPTYGPFDQCHAYEIFKKWWVRVRGTSSLSAPFCSRSVLSFPDLTATLDTPLGILSHPRRRYRCTNPKCTVVIKRHSKSVDIRRQVCGRCGSSLEFLGGFQRDGL